MKYGEEEKKKWLDGWRQSGKSAWAYAKENGLNRRTFVKWTKTGKDAKQSFIELPAHVRPPPHPPEILVEKGDIKIRIPLITGLSDLRAVIEGLTAVL